MQRRTFLKLTVGAGTAAMLPAPVFAEAQASLPLPRGGGTGLAYFARFGINETVIRLALAEALSHGADFADIFLQHRIVRTLAIEDGVLSRGANDVVLGVGIRAVKGDRSGYGYSETLTVKDIRAAATTAAGIAVGS
jgi:TldD protein